MNSSKTNETSISATPPRRQWWWRDWTAWALLAAGLAFQAYAYGQIMQRTGGQPGAPLDDTYIHLNFARGLLRGQGFAYNPGELEPGTTSPGWTALLAIASLSEDRLFGAAIALSLFFYLATAIALWGLARDLKLSRGIAFFAALMALMCGRLLWAGQSGMEIGAFIFLLLCGVRRHLRDRRRGGPGAASALLFGLAACFRPEGYLVYLLILFDHVLDQWIAFDPATRQFHFVRRPIAWRRWAVALGIFSLCIAPYILFCLSTTGRIFPNTYYVKRNPAYTVFSGIYLIRVFETLRDSQGALLFFLFPGTVGLMATAYQNTRGRWRDAARARILWLLPMGFFLGQSILSPTNLAQFGRYIMPMFPLLILICVVGAGLACEAITRSPSRFRAAFAGYAIFAAAWFVLAEIGRWSGVMAQSVDNINDQHVEIGRWLKENTPPDATIASHDAGAIPYFSERYFIDTLGLVTSEVMKIIDANRDIGALDMPQVTDYIRQVKPDYVVSYNSWFSLCTYHFEAFEMVKEVDLGDDNLVCGDPVMHVWKSTWADYDPRVDEWIEQLRYSDEYAYDFQYGEDYGYTQTRDEDLATTNPTPYQLWAANYRKYVRESRRQDL